MRFRQRQDEARAATRQLLFLFVLVVAALALALNGALALVWFTVTGFMGGLPRLFFETNTALVLLFVLGGTAVESMRLRSGGGAHVAQWAGGREITSPRDPHERRLLNVVDEMALASGHPRPAVYVLEREDAINAFAAGWSAEEAVVAVTRGAMERLTRDELQGLVAHEFGHMQQGDLRLHMVLLSMVWGLSLVYGYGAMLTSPNEDGRRSGASSIVGLCFMLIGGLGWLAGRALQAAVSRQREYLADACAVQFTRSREGIGGTLRKVWRQAEEGAGAMRERRMAMLAASLLSQPGGWFATHPPLAWRVRRIYGREMPPLPSQRMRAGDEKAAPAKQAPAAEGAHGFADTTFEPALDRASGRALDPATPSTGMWAGSSNLQQGGEAIEPAFPPGPHLPAALRARKTAAAQNAFSSPLELMGTTVPPTGLELEDRDAMARLAILHGPLGRRAALLALMTREADEGFDAARRSARLQALQRETHALVSAPVVIADIGTLGPTVRLPWFETFAQRSAQVSARERSELLDSANRLVNAGGAADALDLLHFTLLKRRIEGAPQMLPSTAGHKIDLPDLGAGSLRHVASFTGLLAQLLPEPFRAQWVAAVIQAWPRRAKTLPVGVPDEAGFEQAALGLWSLPLMLRPQIVRHWVMQARTLAAPRLWPPGFVDGLRLSCALLDCPLPPEVAARYTELEP